MEKKTSKIWAVVPAAGSGKRMGGDTRKQYLALGDEPILVHTLNRLSTLPFLSGIVLSLPAEDRDFFKPFQSQFSLVRVVNGGATRFESVKNGVLTLPHGEVDWVMIHDAVRPLASEGLYTRVLRRVLEDKCGGGAIAALPLKGTIKRAAARNPDLEGRLIAGTVDRRELFEAQTPQVFSYSELRRAYLMTAEWTDAECERVTDEAYLMEKLGVPVSLVDGEETNIKITRPLDLKLGAAFLSGGDLS